MTDTHRNLHCCLFGGNSGIHGQDQHLVPVALVSCATVVGACSRIPTLGKLTTIRDVSRVQVLPGLPLAYFFVTTIKARGGPGNEANRLYSTGIVIVYSRTESFLVGMLKALKGL